ncbi:MULTISPECIES: RluA family pseudouridine synthase [Cupriavidus]|uniref:Pseudouridine synthase n=1 Tax=Cupriavidus pinatubonensis (strain JMP 134 / LMG 1197) TaxID=264198 RepID=Q46YZ6_CUPPJ|nr:MULTISPECIES: RluA family pseudouridine synthase [Cupriavidus]QYY30559.1 RluA family pseudouridine synthase [Cupriavidus pinatubonensis]TPQ35665.1 RluA family pseudouridine synthase [Cupriavidus pinatubonensis]
MNELRHQIETGTKSAPAGPQVAYVTIDEGAEGQRIDNFLLKVSKGVPKSHIYRVLRSGEVRVNKGRVDATYRLQIGDVVRIPPMRVAEPSQTTRHPVPAADFPVLFEDAHLLVINKPAGVAVHGGSGVAFGVIEQLRKARPQAKFLELVHRLDRETSGILVLAKKRSALVDLHEQIRGNSMDKRYFACVAGEFPNNRQHVKLPLYKYSTPDGERRVRVQEDGLPSHTVFSRVEAFPGFTLLEAELKTGRTHQIRVHLAHSGYPIIGDEKYGDFALNKQLARAGARPGIKRMFLHAHRLTFVHPGTREPLVVAAPLPDECTGFLQQLRSQSNQGTPKPGAYPANKETNGQATI